MKIRPKITEVTFYTYIDIFVKYGSLFQATDGNVNVSRLFITQNSMENRVRLIFRITLSLILPFTRDTFSYIYI